MGARGEDRFPGEAGAAGGVARADKSPPSSAQSPLLARATSLRQQQERSSSAAQSKLCPRTGSTKTRAFQRNKGHFAAGQVLLPCALPGLGPEQWCKGSCPRMVTRAACSGTPPAGRTRPARSQQSHCSRVFQLQPQLSALKTRDRQSGQGGAQKILT